MSTSHTDTGKDQDSLSPGSASLYNQDTLEAQQVPAFGTFPQPPPPARPPRSTRKRWLVGVTIAVLLLLVLSLGTMALLQLGKQPAGKVTPTPTSPAATATTSTSPAVTPTTTPHQASCSAHRPARQPWLTRPTGCRSSSRTPTAGL